jgi:hypothetical protein
MDVERRGSRREIFFTEVSIEGKHLNAQSRITDIGLNGVFIDTRSPLPVGTMLRLSFGLGKEHFVTTEGIVVHSMPSVGMGIQFTELKPEEHPY